MKNNGHYHPYRSVFLADAVDLTLINDLKQRFLHGLLPELNDYFTPLSALLSTYLE